MEEKKDDECVINKFVVGCLICYRKNKRTNDEREREREREELEYKEGIKSKSCSRIYQKIDRTNIISLHLLIHIILYNYLCEINKVI